jgi:3-oxoadipate enol-lactonase
MSWWQQVGHLSQTYTCVTFAHRGFAPSTLETSAPEPAQFADDLAALLAHLRIDQAHLVGQSMGGWTMIEYCLRAPATVRSLVLSATTGSIDPARIPGIDSVALAHWKVGAARSAAECRSNQVHPAAGMRMAREQPALHLLYQQIDALSRDLDKETLRARLQALRVRSPEGLAATGVPVLLVSPDEDIVIPPPGLHALSRALPDARLVQLPKTGHSPYFENPQAFNRCLEDFLHPIDRE